MNDAHTGTKKLLPILSTTLAIIFWFSSGFDAGRHHYGVMSLNLFFALAFSALAAIGIRNLWHDRMAELRGEFRTQLNEAEEEIKTNMETVAEDLKTRLDAAIADHQRSDTEALVYTCLDEVMADSKNKAPNQDERKRIEDLFHERSDRYLKVEVVMGGLEVEISREPFFTDEKKNGEHTDVVKRVSRRATAKKG